MSKRLILVILGLAVALLLIDHGDLILTLRQGQVCDFPRCL